MATTSLDIAERTVNAAPAVAHDAARAEIEKRAELHVVAGQAAGRPSGGQVAQVGVPSLETAGAGCGRRAAAATAVTAPSTALVRCLPTRLPPAPAPAPILMRRIGHRPRVAALAFRHRR